MYNHFTPLKKKLLKQIVAPTLIQFSHTGLCLDTNLIKNCQQANPVKIIIVKMREAPVRSNIRYSFN